MSLSAAQPVIYMIDSQSATLASMRPLLEASGRPVMEVDDADTFSHDVLAHRTVRRCDAIILDLDGGQAPIYRLLNLVMGETDRPKIVLMAGDDAPLGDTDSFLQSRLHVLHHPARPRDLLDILDYDS
jgi:DNA-binding NarL/FixJ family response regulator